MNLPNDRYITGANWRHKGSGKVYCIVGFSTREEDMALLVSYREAAGVDRDIQPIWTRDASEFFDGRFVRMFPGYQDREKDMADVFFTRTRGGDAP